MSPFLLILVTVVVAFPVPLPISEKCWHKCIAACTACMLVENRALSFLLEEGAAED
jgi:hypothetical protein